MFKDISISNFKGIKEGKLEDLAQVNILVGQNNSGKSTVLESLVFSRALVAFRDRLDRDVFTQILLRRVQRPQMDYRELWFKFKNEDPINISLNINNISISIFCNKELVMLLKGRSPQGNFNRTVRFSSSEPAFWEGDNDFEKFGKEEQQNLSGLLLIDSDYMRHLQDIEIRVWNDLIPRRRDKQITKILNEIYNLNAEDISFVPYSGGHKLYVKFSDHAVPIDSLGEGTRYAFAIISTAALLNNTAFLIEELECHQHIESLKLLLKALFKITKENSIQLFITTQSLELIDYALDAAEIEKVDLKIYHLMLSKEGILTARSILAPDAKLLAEVGPDIRRLYQYVQPS